jgi:hypothetical protein
MDSLRHGSLSKFINGSRAHAPIQALCAFSDQNKLARQKIDDLEVLQSIPSSFV